MSESFFMEKRRWSRVKDGILSYYIEPYLKIVQTIPRRILLVDTFAGPGRFGDGERGSTLIITEAAEQLVQGRYDAVFTNVVDGEHEQLTKELAAYEHANAYHLSAGDVLRRLSDREDKGETLFLYLDPFGIADCDFELVKPLLDRTQKLKASTELLMVFQMPYVHRQAARDQVLQLFERLNPEDRTYEKAIAGLSSELREKIANVERIMGGLYWQNIEYGDGTPEEREKELIDAYLSRLAEPDKMAMACPVEADFDGPTKYFVCFVSRSRKAALLMNEAMFKSRDEFYDERARHITDERLPLFKGHDEPSPWDMQKQKAHAELAGMIPQYVSESPGTERQQIWFRIMTDHFMHFSRSDYRALVNKLAKANRIVAIKDGERTTVSNDETLLYPPGKAPS